MPCTSPRLWFAVALAVLVAGCAKDTATPTAIPVAADRQQVGGSEVDEDRANEDGDEGDDDAPRAFSYAVIGDFPYGATKRAEMPVLVDKINADTLVRRVLHAGDVKAGSNSPCTDAYLADIRSQFDRFDDPLVYTPGDNEWTDCHVAIKNNGLFTPTERLVHVRALFFPVVGRTLGVHSRRVTSQGQVDHANADYIENVMWAHAGFVFASVNITGSNNDKAPWTSSPALPGELPADAGNYPTQAQEQMSSARATSAWLRRTFRRARSHHAKGVVLLFQADLWDGTLANRATTIDGYDSLVVQIGKLATEFGKPVLLLMGDSHVFRVDQPYTAASPLFGLHPNTPVAPNVTRLVVNGSGSRTEYVRLTIDPNAPMGASPFSWVEVPLN